MSANHSDLDAVRWGILGAGSIANAFAKALGTITAGELVAVGSRDAAKAEAFIRDGGFDADRVRAHGGYAALLADPDVDAVYIATPHPMHARAVVAALEAGKHVLCEKPLGVTASEVEVMIEAAHASGCFLMEAFKDRFHPQTEAVLKAVRDGRIGTVRRIEASFGFDLGDPAGKEDGRLLNPALAGGGILDVGCYPIEWIRAVAGAALGAPADAPFAEPVKVSGGGVIGDTGVDELAAVTLVFEGGILGLAETAIRANLPNSSTIVGDRGTIHVPDPWLNDWTNPSPGRFEIRSDGDTETVEVPSTLTGFAYEARAASEAIRAGAVECPAMSWADSLGNARTLDRWRRDQLKLLYPFEQHASQDGSGIEPVRGTLRHPRRDDAGAPLDLPMTYGRVPRVERPISRFIMGCDNQRYDRDAAILYDAWYELGGNTFDTARIYGGGHQERVLQRWLSSRGVRSDVNIIVKTGHTPWNDPASAVAHLDQSLESLGIDHAEMFFLHRDNPDIPAAEFVDALDEAVSAGKIGVYGGSNWSLDRVREANTHAAANGRQGFELLSNNFSLAHMHQPVWDGCVTASGDAFRGWHEQTQTPNFAWSSQARGYFVSRDADGRADKWDNANPWDAADNRERRDRAFRLADELTASLGEPITAINVAAAYVLCQQFPSFALIGPRTLPELRTSLPALRLQLTPEQCAWLDLRD